MRIKNAFVLINQTNEYPWQAVIEGLHHLGIKTKTAYLGEKFKPDDAVITWNNYGVREHLAKQCKIANGLQIVMENGYLLPQGKPLYFALGRDSHLKIDTQNVHSKRWEALGFTAPSGMGAWKRGGKHILVCAQRGTHIIKHSMPPEWPQDVLSRLRKLTDRPIWYRPHPGRERIPDLSKLPNIIIVSNQEPLENQLNDAHAVVVHSSNCATIALLNGIPVFYEGDLLACAEISQKGIADIEAPFYPDRELFFYRLANSQWNINEIQNGEPWLHVLK